MLVHGDKHWTQTYLKLFGCPWDIPAKSRDIPPKKFDFPGIEGHTELFGPHPFMWKTPTPLENIRTWKFAFVLFFRAWFVRRKRTVESALRSQFWRPHRMGLIWSVPTSSKEMTGVNSGGKTYHRSLRWGGVPNRFWAGVLWYYFPSPEFSGPFFDQPRNHPHHDFGTRTMVWVSFSPQIYSAFEFWRFKFSVVWVLLRVSSFYSGSSQRVRCRRGRSETPHFSSKLQIFAPCSRIKRKKDEEKRKKRGDSRQKRGDSRKKAKIKGRFPPAPSTPTPLIGPR